MSALTAAAAMSELAPGSEANGRRWTAVCVWCLLAADPHETAPARRCGGDCLRCPYSGRDVFVALLPEVTS